MFLFKLFLYCRITYTIFLLKISDFIYNHTNKQGIAARKRVELFSFNLRKV